MVNLNGLGFPSGLGVFYWSRSSDTLHSIDASLGRSTRGVAFSASGNDLSVAGFESPPILAVRTLESSNSAVFVSSPE